MRGTSAVSRSRCCRGGAVLRRGGGAEGLPQRAKPFLSQTDLCRCHVAAVMSSLSGRRRPAFAGSPLSGPALTRQGRGNTLERCWRVSAKTSTACVVWGGCRGMLFVTYNY